MPNLTNEYQSLSLHVGAYPLFIINAGLLLHGTENTFTTSMRAAGKIVFINIEESEGNDLEIFVMLMAQTRDG
jgi:hypothetical protein